MKVVLSTSVENRDFHPPDDMSPSMQKIYRRTLERFSAHPEVTGSRHAVVPKLKARVSIDGREFESAGEMPPVFRRFYEEALARALPVDSAIYTVARTEHANFIKRAITLAVIAAGCAAAIGYLWLHGYYA